MVFPRQISRGLIEAEAERLKSSGAARSFPRQISRGLIEAIKAAYVLERLNELSATDQSRPH